MTTIFGGQKCVGTIYYNSKSEYNRCALPRISLKVGEKDLKERKEEIEEELRKEEEIEEKIKNYQKQQQKRSRRLEDNLVERE